MTESYTNSDEYQKEIEEQYKKRVAVFSTNDVVQTCKTLGIKIDVASISQATAGNVNATYITDGYVVKMNRDKDERSYYPNKMIGDSLGANNVVVEVVAYDFFEETSYEVLIMKRASGTMLLDDIFELDKQELEVVFVQVLDVVQNMLAIKFENFGNINSDTTYKTYTEYLKYTFTENVKQIRAKKLCKEDDIAKVEEYFLKYVGIFDDEKAVFVHADLHMGNIMHYGDKLTAIIDFDHSLKAPASRILLSLLGFIDMPQQFVEGTKDFQNYKGKNFHHLLPILKEKLSDIFDDPLLLRKLNILGIREGIDWIGANWSAEWNKEMIANILHEELPESDEALAQTYYAKVLGH